jgi:FlaA1/EpsC-like NDP-sugar epimerase
MIKRKVNEVIEQITERKDNFFNEDIKANQAYFSEEIKGKKVMVIGGAGTIGSNFIKEVLNFQPKDLFVLDLNENGLAELVRDIRNSNYDHIPNIYTYALNYADPIFEKMYNNEGPFDIVANFSAHKHVRSEKDMYAIEAMFKNNFINLHGFLKTLSLAPPKHVFCVSTDKAANPVNLMGASKRLMEDVMFSFNDKLKISSARFANVAFSNGSLLESYINRYEKDQPLVCPSDMSRYFVSPSESGSLCLAACFLAKSGEVFIPKFSPESHLIFFRKTLESFINVNSIETQEVSSDEMLLIEMENFKRGRTNKYPVMYLESDTSGEKEYEEFFTSEERVDSTRFFALSVVQNDNHASYDIIALLSDLEKAFEDGIDKPSLVSLLGQYLKNFNHLEKGKTLDQKI